MDLNGTWLSHYEYHSTGRGWQQAGGILAVTHYGANITIATKPHTSPGRIRMHLIATGCILSGTWTEETDPGGYYRGRHYNGIIMLSATPDEDTLQGYWVGPGADGEINTGPWRLTRLHH